MPWRLSAPRVLLRRLREAMANSPGGKVSLDAIVELVAANIVAEVCSIYITRPDNSLELYATQGLKQEAVHNTRLEPDEGLVGLIASSARPVNLPDAQSHPAFSLRPETGEESYSSFLGVPVLRGGRTLGVLTIQNVKPRKYNDEEVEALQTIAMVLAEIISSGAIEGVSVTEADPRRAQTQSAKGVVLSEGIALGHIVFHEPQIMITRLISEDATTELSRLEAAIEQLRHSVDEMLERRDVPLTGEHREILEVYRVFAHDEGWLRKLREAVNAGLTAEAAVKRVQNVQREQMLRHRDSFWRERLHDMDDIANRLLRLLAGRNETAASEELPKDAILVARTMGASELLDYNREKLRGVVLEEGGLTSHVAIVARALGVAAIGETEHALSITAPGDAAVLDAEQGVLHVRPNQDLVKSYTDKVRFRARRQAQYARLREKEARTRDGQRIHLRMNAGLPLDIPHLVDSGADGIGLYRTELQFMISSKLPKLHQQMRTYREIMDAAGDKPVVFRTLDIGGDKVLPYIRHTQEPNPALGWRAVRIALDRPALLRTQIRALLRACAGRDLRVMIPFVTDVAELREARTYMNKEIAHARRHGYELPRQVHMGAMIEVPALLWQLDDLLPEVDFISVGSNDLFQFLFAADRGNANVASRFDPLSLAGLRVLREIATSAERHNVPLTLCGELAGRPIEAMALIGLGYRSISMSAASIGPVKAMVLELDAEKLESYVLEWLETSNQSIRARLRDFAEANNIPLG
jgi:phosphotransferase system enzyme I (PtsP)